MPWSVLVSLCLKEKLKRPRPAPSSARVSADIGVSSASHEIKVALCHLLLKYDWRFVADAAFPPPRTFEGGRGHNPEGKVEFRTRNGVSPGGICNNAAKA